MTPPDTKPVTGYGTKIDPVQKSRQEHMAKENARRDRDEMRGDGRGVEALRKGFENLRNTFSGALGGNKPVVQQLNPGAKPQVNTDADFTAPRRPSGPPLPGPSGMAVRDPNYRGPTGPVPSDTGIGRGPNTATPVNPNPGQTFGPSMESPYPAMKKGGKVKAKAKSSYSSGGKVSSASKRGDGCAQRGKTKGRMV